MKLFIVTSAIMDSIDNLISGVVKVCKSQEEAQLALKDYHDTVLATYFVPGNIDDEFEEEEGYFDICDKDARITAGIEEVEI